MGKLIRNGIEYGGGNGTDIFEVDQATYNTLKAQDKLVHNALYVITDAPNLNETAKQISYDGGADTVWDKVEDKQNAVKVVSDSGTTSANGNIGVTRTSKFVIISAWCNVSGITVLPFIDYTSASDKGSTAWYLHFMNGNASQSSLNNTNVTFWYAYVEIQ